jgi:TolB protein
MDKKAAPEWTMRIEPHANEASIARPNAHDGRPDPASPVPTSRNRYPRSLPLALAACLLAFAGTGLPSTCAGEPERVRVLKDVMETTPPIPIALGGFSGDVDRVLRFDLEIAGFKFVPETDEHCQYVVKGANNAQVEGRLIDPIRKETKWARTYSGGTLRSQAHALADDVIQAITDVAGIARTRIAFKVARGNGSEIYVADYDGFGAAPITQDGTVVAAPTWVPGRRMLLYNTYKQGNADIVAQDLGSGTRQFVARYAGSNISPAVSPDGRRVVMVLSKSGSPDLYVANLDGSGLRQLTQTRDDESSPCWSPDGRTICFATKIDGRRSLATIPAEGGPIRRITTKNAVNPSEPDWSPDGKYIAFTAQMGNFEICVVRAGGGEARFLGAGEDPCWARNSRTLIFTKRGSGGRRFLSLLDVPTKQSKDITQNVGNCSQPSWAR